MSDMEGKATRVGASERGQRTSFNGANGMNTPCWEAGGWTALVGGNPTERIGRSRVNDMEGKATRAGASERGQRTSFNARERGSARLSSRSGESTSWQVHKLKDWQKYEARGVESFVAR